MAFDGTLYVHDPLVVPFGIVILKEILEVKLGVVYIVIDVILWKEDSLILVLQGHLLLFLFNTFNHGHPVLKQLFLLFEPLVEKIQLVDGQVFVVVSIDLLSS